ncbi:MAG: prepilin-type N-terminal cleavage/methylation domain-containing protein [Acidobacteria bacterium]|nr:prepilin-type N-terminal cleavage/methylation domain-containing protein [Acidobacteriota bacterium]
MRHAPPSERGFTLIEFMIAAAIMTAVLGGTVMLASQLQQAYTSGADDVAVEQEARFALDWITRILRSAGSNPYSDTLGDTTPCPTAGTIVEWIVIDPNTNGASDDIRIQADVTGAADGTPDGKLGGDVGGCTQEGEDVTIAHDPSTLTITLQDTGTGGAAQTMTERVISGLEFIYYDSSHTVLCGDPCGDPSTINEKSVSYIKARITGRSQTRNTILAQQKTTVFESEVRVRVR